MNQSELREKYGPLISAFPKPQAALGPLLHELIDSGHSVSNEEVVGSLAGICGVSPESVRSIVSMYGLAPSSENKRTSVCTGLICYLNGARRVYEGLKRDPSIVGDENTEIVTTACVGHCYAAPVIEMGDEGFFRVCVENLR
ncbi:MAG TPA: NAD(P)H-dependent oxidoreductase subunit E [Blastocatellia bacterium]|jgi:NADH:ubiquinone oxidoreductase subunit E|nr:NAD(P)H-dependent oxidoreductase subunit E [Blastocatellia bacterium]